MATRLNTKEHYEELLDKYDTWMFDCDGVLWHGTKLIDGVIDVIAMLRSRSQSVAPNSKIRL